MSFLRALLLSIGVLIAMFLACLGAGIIIDWINRNKRGSIFYKQKDKTRR